jgi:hypothetical protein
MSRQLLALQERLSAQIGHAQTLSLMVDKGLAHWHARWIGHGLVARVPKQSQMGLSPVQNLAYEAACFDRAATSQHTPRLHQVIAPDQDLPWGALLVEEISGSAASAQDTTHAVMLSLAALHKLPLPPANARAPLLDAPEPAQDLIDLINAQAVHLNHAGINADTRRCVNARLQAMRIDLPICCAGLPKRLIAFDAHPGNFLIRDNGQAVLVDLEKMRYSFPPLDLAHATLYTSTTWDVHSAFELTTHQVAQAYQVWLSAMGEAGAVYKKALVPLREAMWLWSMTWCAQWLSESDQNAKTKPGGQDWSAQHSDAALIAHVRARVQDFLAPRSVQRVQDEFDQLRKIFV